MRTEADRFNAALGRQIRAEIAAGGSSIAAMSRAINVARSTLDNYVTGERAIPVTVAYAICEELNISPADVIRRAEDRFRSEESSTTDQIAAARARKTGIGVASTADDELKAVARPTDPEPDEEPS